jgi:hypothetical protein
MADFFVEAWGEPLSEPLPKLSKAAHYEPFNGYRPPTPADVLPPITWFQQFSEVISGANSHRLPVHLHPSFFYDPQGKPVLPPVNLQWLSALSEPIQISASKVKNIPYFVQPLIFYFPAEVYLADEGYMSAGPWPAGGFLGNVPTGAVGLMP